MSDSNLRSLQRAARQGDAEDKARYLAVLVKTGKLSRAAVQLAAMFVEAPEARLLEPDDHTWQLGLDADLRHKFYQVAHEANYAGVNASELARQLLLWYNNYDPLPKNMLTRLQENKRFVNTQSEWSEMWIDVDTLFIWVYDLFMQWQFQVVYQQMADALTSMSIQFHITPELVSNFVLYGSVEGP